MVRGSDGKFVAKLKRGRPLVYKGADKKHILELMQKYGSEAGALARVREVLEEEKRLVPTLPMLVNWAKQAKIAIKLGRPKKVVESVEKVAEAA